MKVEIPDKICPHCGGTTWYAIRRNDRTCIRYRCVCVVRKFNALRKRKSQKRCNADERPTLKNMYADILTPVQFKKYMQQRTWHLYRGWAALPEQQEKEREYSRAWAKTERGREITRKRNKRQYYRDMARMDGPRFIKKVKDFIGGDRQAVTPEQVEKYREYLKTLRLWRKSQKEQNGGVKSRKKPS